VTRVLVTGAAGSIGTDLRPRLARPGRVLRLMDLVPVPDPGPGEEVVTGSVTDRDAVAAAVVDVDAVVARWRLDRAALRDRRAAESRAGAAARTDRPRRPWWRRQAERERRSEG